MITALTGLRAVAALWVVMFHFHQLILGLLPDARLVKPLMLSGYLGVDVFFLLSGFVISHNYAGRLAVLDRRGYRDFMVARGARIYPVHLVSLVLIAAVAAIATATGRMWRTDHDFGVGDLVGNLLLLQAFPGVQPWNDPAWSVSCELAAYLVFPLAAGILLRTSARTSLFLATAVLGSGLVLLLMLYSPTANQIACFWLRIATEFTVGCLLWRMWRTKVRPHHGWDGAAVVAVLAIAAAIMSGAPPLATLPLLALVVLATASASGPVRSLLAWHPMQWGGRVSYSLYMIHYPCFFALVVLHSPWEFYGASLPVRVGLLVGYAVLLVGAVALTYHAVEEPARRWITRRLRSTAGAATLEPVTTTASLAGPTTLVTDGSETA